MTGLKTLVVMGGPDAERDVSIESGTAIAEALFPSDDLHVAPLTIDRVSLEDVRSWDVDVVVPALHGRWGEGGGLQHLLEEAGLHFVGSSAAASQACMNKVTTKERCHAAGVPTPAWEVVGSSDAISLKCPIVIKAIEEGSSIDLAICHDPEEVDVARRTLSKRYDILLVEQYIAGREVTVGLLDGEPLPLIEIVPATAFYDYQAKYERTDTRYLVDPDLDRACADRCLSLARTCWEAMGCRHIARVDFMIDGTEPLLLELNTMPGFTSHSLVPMAAAAAGLSMPALCHHLVMAAHRDGAG